MQLYLPPDNRYRALDQYLMDGKIRRIFLVCGKSLRRLPAGAYFEALEVRLGIRVVTFSDFSPNPSYESVVDGTSRFREAGCDFIAAAGGGSAIDVAKCVKRFANMELTRNCLEQTAAPGDASLLAIPTTAGTGSEATRFAVIYYQGRKQSVAHDDCLPNAVLLDPRLLETLPEYHRKASMLDALCHAVESVWSLRASPESRDYAYRAIRQLLGSMDDYLQNTPDGNLNMLEAANLAGKAINLAQTTAGHALCYGLTSLYGLAHGHAAALCVRRLWPYMVQNVKLSATVGDKTYQFVADAADAAAGNIGVVVGDTDNAAALATKLAAATAPTGATAAATTSKVTFTTTATGTDAKIEAKDATDPIDAPKLKGDYNVSTTNLEKKGEAAGERLASTYFDLSKAMAANGNQITIGKETYTFTTDKDKKGDAGMVYVGDLDLSKKEDLVEAAERLTKAAANNKTYTVGHDGKRMTFTENKDQTEFEDKEALNTYENIEKSFGFKTAAQAAVEADPNKALTLQIGDTSDDYNQLKVSIGDMHTDAMGIEVLSIADQASAADAIQTIRNAINYVSGVRGDLGATQNRLEHTANNLSVMAENIQDAESTIRDTDVAEEMMSYVKNNILVQSAQAMLAQANQVPQGVLQLLG